MKYFLWLKVYCEFEHAVQKRRSKLMKMCVSPFKTLEINLMCLSSRSFLFVRVWKQTSSLWSFCVFLTCKIILHFVILTIKSSFWSHFKVKETVLISPFFVVLHRLPRYNNEICEFAYFLVTKQSRYNFTLSLEAQVKGCNVLMFNLWVITCLW